MVVSKEPYWEATGRLSSVGGIEGDPAIREGVPNLGGERPRLSCSCEAIIDWPGPGREAILSTALKFWSAFEAAVLMGRPVGRPCRDEREVPRDAEGTGEAKRAIDACLLSGAGDEDRTDEVEIGTARGGINDEPSPLSAIVGVVEVGVWGYSAFKKVSGARACNGRSVTIS